LSEESELIRYRWLGGEAMHLDEVSVDTCGQVVIGCYGGSTTAGAEKNEDGALVWCAADGSWEFALLLDSHDTAESAALVIEAVEGEAAGLVTELIGPVRAAFAGVHQRLLSLFGSDEFLDRCRHVRGETACLFCVRKERFLWWLSVGDCALYLLHPDLARRGQYALNQRSFFEWIGQANSLALTAPCYASGVRELREGASTICMATDGLLECGSRPFAEPPIVYAQFHRDPAADPSWETSRVREALQKVSDQGGRDSATVITWAYPNTEAALSPSDALSD
jgi:hypothetical protein